MSNHVESYVYFLYKVELFDRRERFWTCDSLGLFYNNSEQSKPRRPGSRYLLGSDGIFISFYMRRKVPLTFKIRLQHERIKQN